MPLKSIALIFNNPKVGVIHISALTEPLSQEFSQYLADACVYAHNSDDPTNIGKITTYDLPSDAHVSYPDTWYDLILAPVVEIIDDFNEIVSKRNEDKKDSDKTAD